LQLVKTNHDVNVRVSDKVSFEGLPLECNLMALSNKWDVLAVGSNSGKSNPSK
jgi:nucleoporin NUP159